MNVISIILFQFELINLKIFNVHVISINLLLIWQYFFKTSNKFNQWQYYFQRYLIYMQPVKIWMQWVLFYHFFANIILRLSM